MKPSQLKDQTYDIVETAIDLSKSLHGTWERLIQGKQIKPWASEGDATSAETNLVPDDRPDVTLNP